jgi:pimeloyl-ACP methyl ester carboxylesterase
MDAPRIQYARTEDGVSIAYSVMGQGPAVVYMFAPPFCDFSRAWDLLPVNQQIAATITGGGRRFVQLDLRGMGSSSRVKAFDLDGFVLDLEAVVDALGLDRFDLVAITYSTRSHRLCRAPLDR